MQHCGAVGDRDKIRKGKRERRKELSESYRILRLKMFGTRKAVLRRKWAICWYPAQAGDWSH